MVGGAEYGIIHDGFAHIWWGAHRGRLRLSYPQLVGAAGNKDTISILVGLGRPDNQNALQDLRCWIEEANKDLEKEILIRNAIANPMVLPMPRHP